MKTENEKRIPTDLIARALTGEAGSSEKEQLDQWLSESQGNRDLYSQYESIWRRSGFIKPVSDIDVDSEWKQFRKTTAPVITAGREHRISTVRRMAVAASVLVLVSLTFLMVYKQFAWQRFTAGDMVAGIELPDGSELSLYPGTSIKYKKNFSRSERMVELDGEAFFEVVRDTLRPFTVSTKEMMVRVLGTSFNVEAYSSSDLFSVVVEEGRVEVSGHDKEAGSEILSIGEMATYNRTENLLARSSNADPNYSAWRTGELEFDNSTLEYVAETLSEVFRRDIRSSLTASHWKSCKAIFEYLFECKELENAQVNGRVEA